MQTGRQRILDAVAHRQPSRVPFSWGFGPTPEMGVIFRDWLAERGIDWARLRETVSDKTSAGPAYTGPLPPNGNTFVGIFGINMKEVSYGAGSYQEFTDFPLAGVTDVAQIDDYPWPSPDAYDYTSLRDNTLKAIGDRSRALQVHAGNPFEIYCWMTGLEESLVNCLIAPEIVERALHYIGGFMNDRLERTLTEIGDLTDLVFMADDLGGQRGLLMSRDTYRALIQPVHKTFTATVRRLAPGATVLHHSDGAVFDILPDLIDAGVQFLEAVQTDAEGMDPARLKQTYGDRLGYHGAISVQQLLPHRDAQTVEDECRRLVDILGHNGGYIAAPAHAIQVGTPPENILAMLRGVLGQDDYDRAIEYATSP